MMFDQNNPLRQKFLSVASFNELATLLSITPQFLAFCIYVGRPETRYIEFDVKKKSGEPRIIRSPNSDLKFIQRRLNHVLQHVYKTKPSVHGFVQDRSVLTNASLHVGRSFVLNIDLKDFFPSIHFGRVRGMFMASPYRLNPSVATVLAQICCHEQQLPQGAPTSPIVANMVCGRLDSDLQHIAMKYKCYYSRYADDITFSTRLRTFPRDLAILNEIGQLSIGGELQRSITDNGFIINERKTRLHNRSQRQEVTGLTTNVKPNVDPDFKRQIRGMLYAWHKFDLQNAAREYFERYDSKGRSPDNDTELFKLILKGKIEYLGMVRGKEDTLYRRHCSRFSALDLGFTPTSTLPEDSIKDPYSHLENGMAILLRKIPETHSEHTVALGYELRLIENLIVARNYGDSENNSSSRHGLLHQLNLFCKKYTFPLTFNDLCNQIYIG